MWYLFLKALISGIIIVVVSEIAKRSPSMGALVVSLPLISVLGMVWLWIDTKDTERLALHSSATFWMVLPSLPLFLVLPILLRAGVHFYVALISVCLLTVLLYILMVWGLKYFDIHF
jgi:hypothetical protein